MKFEVFSLVDVSNNFIKHSFWWLKKTPFYSVALPGYTWPCVFKFSRVEKNTTQHQIFYFLPEKNHWRGTSNKKDERYVEGTKKPNSALD